MSTSYKYGLSGNALKIIAAISMTFDHIGVIILDGFITFKIIGRIAFPIFAYMISEGCLYTRNKLKYLLNVFLVGLICQMGYFYVEKSLYLNVLLTFSASILLIFIIEPIKKHNNSFLLTALIIISLFLLTEILSEYKIVFDYGFFGIMLPVMIYLSKKKTEKIIVAAIGIAIISFTLGNVQWLSLLSIPFLLFYNKKRGKINMKYFFYVFYPLHMIIIYLVNSLIN